MYLAYILGVGNEKTLGL